MEVIPPSAFATVVRRPGLLVVELVWRWAFALLTFLALLWVVQSALDSVLVSDSALWALRSRNLYFRLLAILYIARSALEALFAAALFFVPLAALLWAVLSTCGRAVVLAGVFGVRLTGARFTAIAGIQALRTLLALASMVAGIGAMWLAVRISYIGGAARPDINIFVIVFTILAAAILFAWTAASAILSLALLTSVREPDLAVALPEAMAFLRRHRRAISALAASLALVRFAVIVLFSVAAAAIAALLLHSRPVLFGTLLVLLALYSVVSALLDLLRLSAMAEMAKADDAPQAPAAARPAQSWLPRPASS